MKQKLIYLTFFITISSNAGSVEVFREPFQSLNSISAKFKMDPEHPENERAWIEVKIEGSSNQKDSSGENVSWNKNIPGLKFNHSTEEITYTDGTTGPVVCARLETSKFLFVHSKNLNETGKCNLTAFATNQSETDGPTQKVAVVTMEIDQNRSLSSTEKMEPLPYHRSIFRDKHR